MNAAEGLKPEDRLGSRRPSNLPVSTEARGRLRVVRNALAARSSALVAASEAVLGQLLRDVRHRTSAGRDKAMATILRMMPQAPLHREKRGALWRVFVPAGDAIVVEALAFGAVGTGGWTRQHFGLRFEFHALARLLDRSSFLADPLLAMAEAHDALLQLTPSEGEAAFALADISLPAGPGIFLVTPEPRSPESNEPRARAKTWLSSEQLRGNEAHESLLWNQLIY